MLGVGEGRVEDLDHLELAELTRVVVDLNFARENDLKSRGAQPVLLGAHATTLGAEIQIPEAVAGAPVLDTWPI